MPLPGKYTPIDIKPLTGYFDVRSSPDAVKPGTWRYRQNISVTESAQNCRRTGWAKLFDKANYNNEDLHDQLLGLQEYYLDRPVPITPQSDITIYPPNGRFCDTVTGKKIRGLGRQPFTFLFPVVSRSGDRRLLAGTQNRLYVQNESKGNWKIIADAYGGEPSLGLSERRWAAAQVDDTILFANGFDPILSWTFDAPTFGCAMQAVVEVQSLKDINVTRAGVIASWRGIVILGDVEKDGERHENALQWSQSFDPLNFIPVAGETNIASFYELGAGERILAMEPLGDVLLIFTTKGIWEATYVGPPQAFSFRSLYSAANGAGCLAYRFTIANTGQEIVYAGRDGIYVFNLFLPQPERVEWMHAASAVVFDTIDDRRCDSHSAWFVPDLKEYRISWTERGQDFPRRTLVFNTRYRSDDIVDHGFTAFCTYVPDTRPTYLQWLLDNLLCLRSELPEMADLITPTVKEGGYCLAEPIVDCTSKTTQMLTAAGDNVDPTNCDVPGSAADVLTDSGGVLTTDVENALLNICQNRNLPLWTHKTKDLDGRIIEDLDQPTPDVDSLCSYLDTLDIEGLCHECDAPGVLVMASAEDWCLKENGGVFYREKCIDCSPCGSYIRVGYRSIMRTGALDFSYPREDKNARSIEVEFQAQQQAVPSVLEMRIGFAATAVEPNSDSTGRCALVWRSLKPKNLECTSLRTGPEHIAAGTRPNKPLSWSFFFSGRYVYVELAVDGINGACCFSRLSLEVRQRPRSATSG